MALVLAGLAAGAFLAHPSPLRWVGQLGVYEKADFEWAEAAVILPGGVPARALGAADLLATGRVAAAWLVVERMSVEDKALLEFGIRRLQDYEINRQVLERKGVAPERIIEVPGDSESTWDDAQNCRQFWESRPVKSLVLVTSRLHSYRAFLNFQKAFEDTDVVLYSVPSKHSRFEPEAWWTDRDQVKELYVELASLTAFYLGFR